MGVLQRFEQRLGGLVEGAFARVFGGVVQPVEVAAALQREARDKKAIVGQGRVLVPNEYVVELGESDSARLGEYDAALRAELAAMVREHAAEQGWSFVGPVGVQFEQVDDISTGVFRVRSTVAAAEAVSVRAAPPARPRDPGAAATGRQPSRVPAQAPATASRSPRLVVETGRGQGRSVDLSSRRTVLGRGAEADLQVADTSVSRRHAELHLDAEGARLVDLGSTNGTRVNGRRVDDVRLNDGDRLELGETTLVYRQDG